MGDSKNERTNGSGVSERIRSIAFAWDGLDDALEAVVSAGGYTIRGIKLIPKGTEWLIVIQGVLNDDGFVQFKTATSSGDLGKMIRIGIESDDWKQDKFWGLDKK